MAEENAGNGDLLENEAPDVDELNVSNQTDEAEDPVRTLKKSLLQKSNFTGV